MVEHYLNNRFIVLYTIPFLLGLLTVFSFQPFNFSILNFFILPVIFYSIVFIKKKSKSTYRKKPYRKNLFIFGTIFGFSFFLSNIHWITNSLTFDEKILKPLISNPLSFDSEKFVAKSSEVVRKDRNGDGTLTQSPLEQLKEFSLLQKSLKNRYH